MVTLHPQSAMEHLHHRFIAADGTGSDGAIAFEATEVSATTKQRKLVPVKPAEPLAGTPDRSPIPLADSVTAGAAAVQQSARQAKTAAGGAAGRFLGGIQDRLPRRSGPTDRRVTPLSTAARDPAPGGRRGAGPDRRRRLARARGLVPRRAGRLEPGPRLADGRPEGAHGRQGRHRPGLCAGGQPGQERSAAGDRPADEGLAAARRGGRRRASRRAPSTRSGRRRRTGLDELYKMDSVAGDDARSRSPTPTRRSTSRGVALGPDKAPYVLDAATHAVYRIDLKGGKAAPVARAGQSVGGVKVGRAAVHRAGRPGPARSSTRRTRSGAGDRPTRPARGRWPGSRSRNRRAGATTSGRSGRSCRNADQGLYNLYVVDPSAKQILVYTPAFDGSRLPGRPERLAGRTPGRRDRRVDGHRRRHLPVPVGHDQSLRPRRQHRLEAGATRATRCSGRPRSTR